MYMYYKVILTTRRSLENWSILKMPFKRKKKEDY